MPSTQRVNRGQSSAGMPIISEITIIGSGTAKSAARSISPRAATASISRRDSAATRGSSPATIRGVNPREISARWRLCRGGSRNRNHDRGAFTCELNTAGSPSTRRTPS
jgi:hypothetical protein